MEDAQNQTAGMGQATLDREMQLVREAIAMVAGGGARRIVVAGISFGDLLLGPGGRLALQVGVRLTRLETADGAGADLAVERIRE
jgi:hypothetical protein